MSVRNPEKFRKYGSGLVALTTKNLYFQQNGMWQKVRRNCVVSCEEDLGDLYITISEPSGMSKQIQPRFFDFEVVKMLGKLLKS